MTFRDMIDLAAGNLWRMKLRTGLTVAGVVIAIAAFVAMLSFGAGNQRVIREQFDELGLFSMVIVRPGEATDTTVATELTDSSITMFSQLEGVSLVYPYDAFQLTADVLDTQLEASAQALTVSALHTPFFSDYRAGRPFTSDSSHEAVVTSVLLQDLGLENADTLIGSQLILSVRQSVIDSALIHLLDLGDGGFERRVRAIEFRKLRDADYRDSILSAELGSAISRFVDGYMNATVPVAETLTVVGVLNGRRHGRASVKQILLPASIARRLAGSGFNIGNPSAMVTALASGRISFQTNGEDNRTYNQVTVLMTETASYEKLRDTIQAMGYNTFSFAEQFKEIRRAMIYFNMGIGLIGLIALITASLGIANTMIMSIMERTREIGMLISLGATSGDIKVIFLVESGVIGAVGAILGIIFGWLISRLGSTIVQTIMEHEGITPIDIFDLPLWLITIAFAFGTVVAVLAGLYPASRAARIDPVKALRGE
ncbi:ABC transporter permease [bacterium]|nr:ABC transporter permease [bacterium]